MDKIKQFLDEAYYKSVALANVAVNEGLNPKESIQKQEQSHLNNIRELDSQEKTIKKDLKIKGYELKNQIIQVFLKKQLGMGKVIEKKHESLEEELKDKYNFNTEQYWLSRQNIKLMSELLNQVQVHLLDDLKRIGYINSNHYFQNWTFLQKACRKWNASEIYGFDAKLLFYGITDHYQHQQQHIYSHPKLIESWQIKEQFKFYIDFYYTIFGDLQSQVQQGQSIESTIHSNNYHNYLSSYNHTLSATNIISYNFTSSPLHPSYLIYNYPCRKELIISIRGTQSYSDVLTDLHSLPLTFTIFQSPLTNQSQLQVLSFSDTIFESSKDKDIFGNNIHMESTILLKAQAHAGIFTAGIHLYIKVMDALFKHSQSISITNYSTIITGHSLGGAVSQVLLLLMILYPPTFVNHFYQNVKAFVTGSPPVMSQEVEPLLHKCLFNLVLKNDVIPRMQYATIKDISKTITYLHELEKKDQGFNQNIQKFQYLIKKNFDGEGVENFDFEKQQCLETYQYIKQKSQTTEKLKVIGNTYIMLYSKDYKDYCIFKKVTNDKLFEQIIFSKNLIDNHIGIKYKQYLDLPQQLFIN